MAPLGPHFCTFFYCPVAAKPTHIRTEIASQEKWIFLLNETKMPVMVNENQLPSHNSYYWYIEEVIVEDSISFVWAYLKEI